ncbi:YczE/YyaS/YitT family protein [Neobacillus sp. LXY-4]|uniref:YczE/YyaS/YitT family protein n=1 Tax=Neobacillus sp. LXY-4 TaxID=3379826 RepID=UPI003EDF0C2C
MGKRILYYLTGLFIACLGVSFIIHSKAGAGPWDIVNMGLTEKLGFTLGTWMALSQAFFLLLNAVILKRRPEYESIITILIWGFVIDFWMEIVFKNLDLALAPAYIKWSVFILGVLLVGMGVGIYLPSNLPRMPYDGTMVALSNRFKIGLNLSRTILEGSAVVLGFIIGGTVGIGLGTLVIFISIGHIIQFFNRVSVNLYNKKIIY